jgi:hypothetical protein
MFVHVDGTHDDPLEKPLDRGEFDIVLLERFQRLVPKAKHERSRSSAMSRSLRSTNSRRAI